MPDTFLGKETPSKEKRHDLYLHGAHSLVGGRERQRAQKVTRSYSWLECDKFHEGKRQAVEGRGGWNKKRKWGCHFRRSGQGSLTENVSMNSKSRGEGHVGICRKNSPELFLQNQGGWNVQRP